MPRLCLCLLLSLGIASSASAVTMAWTSIGNPGNACDPQSQGCFGSVPYAYSIGTYDVTNAQYVEFLNAKAKSDALELYDTDMANPAHDPCCGSGYGGITRSGSSGSYTYSAIAGSESMPVNYVSFYDALRFTNWMNNGQGSSDTETGAYTLLGGTPTPSNGMTVTRNAGATIVLPSENEWYKAAYYDASSSSYFAYPAGSNTQTTCATPTATPNSANCNNNPGDFAPVQITPVGSYTGSASPYGTFDQGGNVTQWNEAIIQGSYRGVRGGSFRANAFNLAAAAQGGASPYGGAEGAGFRLVVIPEPSTGLLVIAGLLGLARWRRARLGTG